jgi:hypothetical protein
VNRNFIQRAPGDAALVLRPDLLPLVVGVVQLGVAIVGLAAGAEFVHQFRQDFSDEIIKRCLFGLKDIHVGHVKTSSLTLSTSFLFPPVASAPTELKRRETFPQEVEQISKRYMELNE